MAAKVNFNEITKIITITLAPDASGEIFIDVKTDLYSDGKEDWVLNENLRKFAFPIRSVGGDDLPGSKALGATFFLASDWKIRPYEASHKLVINGNLYSEDGSDPFLDTLGTFTVRIIQQVSSLVDSTVQQLTDIEYASFGGGVTIDVINGQSGTGGAGNPIGNIQKPVDNTSDALIIATERGFDKFFIKGDITLNNYTDFNEVIFVGESKTKSIITIDTNADVDKCEFYDSEVTGVLDGGNVLKNCLIGNLNYVNGFIENCVFKTGTITLGGNEEAHFLDCWSGVVGSATPIIDMGGSGQGLGIRNYNGGIKIQNKSGSEKVSIDVNSGHVVLDSTITNGEIVVRGVGTLTDNSTGSATVDSSGLMSKETISSAIYDEVGSEIQYSSFGGGVTIDVVNGVSGTLYNIGTIENPVNNLTDAVSIANTRGFNTLFINKSMTLDSGTDMIDFNIVGKSRVDTEIVIDPSAICNGIGIERCNVSGTLDGNTIIRDCTVGDLTYVNGNIMNSGLYGTIILAGSKDAYMVDCSTVDVNSIPTIDMGGSGQNIFLSDWSGGIKFRNMNSDNKIGVQIDGGMVFLESTISAGFVGITGTGQVVDNSTGNVVVDINGLFNAERLNAAVWEECVLDCVNGISGTVFPIGTHGNPVNNLTDALTICDNNSIEKLQIHSDLTVESIHSISGMSVETHGVMGTEVTLVSGCSVNNTVFRYINLEGVISNNDPMLVENCSVFNLTGFTGVMQNVTFMSDCKLTLNNWAELYNCAAGAELETVPEVSIGDSILNIQQYRGNLKLIDKIGDNRTVVGCGQADVIIGSTCVSGSIQLLGVSTLTDNSGVNCQVDTNSLISNESVTDAMLDENIYDHTISGSLGLTVNKIKKETGLIPALV
jgi:hypothetical protein